MSSKAAIFPFDSATCSDPKSNTALSDNPFVSHTAAQLQTPLWLGPCTKTAWLGLEKIIYA